MAKVRSFLLLSDAEKLMHAFIAGYLDYCNSVCQLIKQHLTNEIIQNAAGRTFKKKKKDHVAWLLCELLWLPVTFRKDSKILLLIKHLMA